MKFEQIIVEFERGTVGFAEPVQSIGGQMENEVAFNKGNLFLSEL